MKGNWNKKPSPPRVSPDLKFKKEWITNGIQKDAINFAEKFGKALAGHKHDKNALSSSQIRNVYGEMKRIQLKGFEQEKTAFYLLKPKLAYAKARVNGRDTGIDNLEKVLSLALNEVTTEQQYQNLMDFMEAVLAYHKSFGGK